MSFQPTQVNPQGLSTLIRNLGRDCPPSQYLREFVKNSIEACQRTQKPGRQIVLDFNHLIYQASGFYKIAFTDNGDGMSPEQMQSLLNNLSASGAISNEHQNYGVGAKISAMTRNHAGIQYESWKDNKGYCIFIRYNAEEDVYGMQGFITGTGSTTYVIPLSPDAKPNIIDEHGTRVTLIGMTETQDTMLAPAGVSGDQATWMLDYLNGRFFTLPSNIAISARVGYFHPPEDSSKNNLKRVLGYRALADQHCEAKGELRLSNANAYWWILPEDCEIEGQTALINQGELFELSDGRSNRLTYFGIVVGRNRIILMIEPDGAQQNTPRTHLVYPDGSPMNWTLWQDEFRKHMPEAIKEFIDSLLNNRNRVAHSTSILNRLRSLLSLYHLSGYKASPNKEMAFKVAPKVQVPAEEPPPEEETAATTADDEAENELPDNPPEPPTKDEDSKDPPQDDEPEEEFSFFPSVQWSNESNSPHLAGRAAEYLESSNLIVANRDFRGFQDLEIYFTDKYSETELYPNLVIDAITEAIEQLLMECVAGVLSLQGTDHWHHHHIHGALSPEALSTAVMQRYWTTAYIDLAIRTRLQQQAGHE